MDVRYINLFVRSVNNTFQTMCNLTVSVGKPVLKKEDDPATDVSGVIGFSGDAAGSVAILFSYETASKIATAFSGTEITPGHEDFSDAIGELVNIIAGGAKSQLEGLKISISLPNVICGKNHNITASKCSPRIIIPCNTDAGTFYLEIGMVLSKSITSNSEVTTVGANK